MVRAEDQELEMPLATRGTPLVSVTASVLAGVPELAGLSVVVHASGERTRWRTLAWHDPV